MVIRTAAEGPVEFAFVLIDRKIIDAGKSTLHETVCVELPVLVSVRTEPVVAVVAPLVGITHGDPILRPTPEFLDQQGRISKKCIAITRS